MQSRSRVKSFSLKPCQSRGCPSNGHEGLLGASQAQHELAEKEGVLSSLGSRMRGTIAETPLSLGSGTLAAAGAKQRKKPKAATRNTLGRAKSRQEKGSLGEPKSD